MSRKTRNGAAVGVGIAMLAGVLWLVLSRRDGADKQSGSLETAVHEQRGTPEAMVAPGTRPRLPLRFRARRTEAADGSEAEKVLEMLGDGGMPAKARVRELQGMRGREFSEPERVRAMEFLSGTDRPEGVVAANIHWISDELLTALRLQEPPQEDLAARLAEVAFQPGTDPVVRDYIMQHLGHLWEQYGAREEIEDALWVALDSGDETTPGTALIALSRGYARDGKPKSVAEVRERALQLAGNGSVPLATRVTALAIAGE
ncbi:MAG: hypothetical protein KDN05_19920, partial [Verrucomicrobiae bacterium]|nr:hypothetical protein [Verrucomicrobiae bacterium]